MAKARRPLPGSLGDYWKYDRQTTGRRWWNRPVQRIDVVLLVLALLAAPMMVEIFRPAKDAADSQCQAGGIAQ